MYIGLWYICVINYYHGYGMSNIVQDG